MSFTSRLHRSKRGPCFEWQNVLVPHETTIIDKMPSTYRKQLCPNWEVSDLFILHLTRLIFTRLAACSICWKACSRARSLLAELRKRENTNMTRDESNRRHPNNRLRLVQSPSREEVDQRMLGAHTSRESHGIPHDIQCIAGNSNTESKKDNAPHEAMAPNVRHQLHDPS